MVSVNYVYFYCALQGEDFVPSSFLNNDQFEVLDYHYRGDLAEKGKFKGHILNDGYVRFKSNDGDFDEFVKNLYSAKDLIIENRAERRELHIFLGYKGQCNWEFDPSTLAVIVTLNLTLTISCDEINDDYSWSRGQDPKA